jgi:hypothetical protein
MTIAERNWMCPIGGGTIVPKRYLRSSDLSRARFNVRRIHAYPIRFLKHPTGGAIQIPPSYLCVIGKNDKNIAVLVDRKKKPQIADALLLMWSIGGGEHRHRYLKLYQAYECLQATPTAELAAVRHGLSHAAIALSHPKTVSILVHLFGSTRIDTSNHAHLKILYQALVRLALEVDSLVSDAIMASLPSLRVLSSIENIHYGDGKTFRIVSVEE